MHLKPTFFSLAILASVMRAPPVHSCPQEQTGTVVLHATDIDTGEPIADVSFAIQNSLAEMWADNVGKSNKAGKLEIESKPQSGYYYLIFPVPEGYKVVGLDDMPSGIEPGMTTLHRFHLQRLDAEVSVPPLISRPDDAKRQLPAKAKDGAQETKIMPGFENQAVQFHFVDTQIAEDIFRNGKRLRAAIDSELSLFQKSEGKKAGNIKELSGVKIVNDVREGKCVGWFVWCRTEGGMKLRQDGFKIYFNSEFDNWNLNVPDYLQPSFGQ